MHGENLRKFTENRARAARTMQLLPQSQEYSMHITQFELVGNNFPSRGRSTAVLNLDLQL